MHEGEKLKVLGLVLGELGSPRGVESWKAQSTWLGTRRARIYDWVEESSKYSVKYLAISDLESRLWKI